MLSYLAPILVFGLVIFVHELGHFLAAKLLGVYAPRFSVGFGPALFKMRRGETEYILAALPLGGYVRMASRLDEETAFLEGGSEEAAAKKPEEWDDPEAMVPFGPKPVPPDRWFESKPLWARVIIMIAGVTMNFILAFFIYSLLSIRDGRPTIPTTVVGAVPSVAQQGGGDALQPGDTIRAVNGKPVSNWNQVMMVVEQEMGSTLTFDTHRGPVAASVPIEAKVAFMTGLDYFTPAVIDSVIPGQAADSAGFARGDSVVAIGSEPVRGWGDLTRIVGRSAGTPLTFRVVRPAEGGGAGSEREIVVTPRATPVPNPLTGKADTLGKIGAARRNIMVVERVGVIDGIRGGAADTWHQIRGVVKVVRALFVGEVSVTQLGGPVAIGKLSVTAARGGVESLFLLIAFISINIAVLNLLPIPILDGGQIILTVIESARGKPFSLRTREYILRVGLILIAALFVTVMVNDTRGGFERLWQWLKGALFGG